MTRKDIDGKKLTIGRREYTINIKESLQDNDWGQARHANSEILVRGDLDESSFMETIWHEIVHCMLDATGRIEEKKNEGLCDILGKMIWWLFQDNPWLVELAKKKGI